MEDKGVVQVEVTIQDGFSDQEADRNLTVLVPIADNLWQEWFHAWLLHLQPDFSPIQSYELSLRLTDDAEVRSLNAQFRHIDHPTDVLSFAALEDDFSDLEAAHLSEPLYLGDIVISVETAIQQASQQQHSLTQELAWLATHGLLHLLGWDHPDEPSLIRMLEQQAVLLQIAGLQHIYDDPDVESVSLE